MGLAVGPRPAGLAHRVLRDGGGDARRAVRDPRRRQRPDLPPPRERGGADARRRAGTTLAQIWMHNGMLQMGDEKMAKSVGNIALLGDVLDEVGPRRADLVASPTGHYRQPLAFTREQARRRRAAGGADPRRRAAGSCRASRPEALAPHRDAFFDALADDFNTPRALAALAEWMREANRADGAGRRRARARDARRARAREPARRRRRPRRRRSSRWPSAARRRARRATSPRPTGCATSCARAGWEVRDGAAGPELVPRRVTA